MTEDPAASASWLLSFRQAGDLTVEGHARDPAEPERRLVVELRLDGATVAATIADLAAPDRIDELDPYCGFAFIIPEQLAVDEPVVEAWIANSDIRIGSPFRLAPFRRLRPAPFLAGEVGWWSGLRIDGWCGDPSAFPIAIRTEAGELLATVPVASGLADSIRFLPPGPRPGFTGILPRRIADGEVHRLRVTDAAGQELAGSPLTICIDPELADQPGQGETADEANGPIRDEAGAPQEPLRETGPIGFIFVGEADLDRSVAALEDMPSVPWVAAALASDAGPGVLDRAALRQALAGELSACEVLLVAPAGVGWTETGVVALCDALASQADALLAHGDLALESSKTEPEELRFNAFDYHRCLRQPYPSIAYALRAEEVARAAGDEGPELSLTSLFLRRIDPFAAPVVHVPRLVCSVPVSDVEPLAPSWARAVQAHLTGQRPAPTAVRSGPTRPLPSLTVETQADAAGVSVLVPVSPQTAEQAVALVKRLLAAPPPGGLEVLLIEAGSEPSGDKNQIGPVGAVVRRVRTTAARHDLARQMNEGIRQAANDHVILLDPALTPLGAGCVGELAALLLEPNVATASGVVVDDDGWVVEAGFWTGFGFQPSPACAGWPLRSDLQSGRLSTVHAVSGSSWHLLALRRQTFLSLDGFDERGFTTFFFAADFCFRADAAGHRHLIEPRALFRRGPRPVGRLDPTPRNLAFSRELALLRKRWPAALAADRCYSPRLDEHGAVRAFSGPS